jgi:hypothetical protein
MFVILCSAANLQYLALQAYVAASHSVKNHTFSKSVSYALYGVLRMKNLLDNKFSFWQRKYTHLTKRTLF